MNRARPANRPKSRLYLLFLLPIGVLAALYLSWRMLAQVDFLYPFFYEAIGVDVHIDEFAPQNRYRHGFEHTDRDERLRLFGEIVISIRDGGRGLAKLDYHDSDGRTLGILLRPPEIVHLTDVARVVGFMEKAGIAALAFFAAGIFLLRRRGVEIPSASRLTAMTAAVAVLAAGVILWLGSRKIFYALHGLIFPDGHQWFFYYQDSLMSTMMKAPYLFGYIAITLVALSLVVLWGLLLIARRLTVSRDQGLA